MLTICLVKSREYQNIEVSPAYSHDQKRKVEVTIPLMPVLNIIPKGVVPDAIGSYDLPVNVQVSQSFQYLRHNLPGMSLGLHQNKNAHKFKTR